MLASRLVNMGVSAVDSQQQFLSELTALLDKISLLSHDVLSQQLKGYKAAEVHTIEYIKKHPESNASQIATGLYVTRGAVSKMTRRLIDRQLIERYQKAGNRKETYFQLTAIGQQVFEIHERLNRQFEARDQVVFEHASAQEVSATLQFLQQYNVHLDAELKKIK